jgi:hypothetical protein
MGRVEGIGSRNFIVLNGGGAPAPAPAMTVADWLARPATPFGDAGTLGAMERTSTRLSHRTGVDPASLLRPVNGTIGVEQLGRIEVQLGTAVSGGYLVSGSTLHELPLGSSLDAKRGVFYWAPILGYLGTYDFVFLKGNQRIPLSVTVRGASGETPPTPGPRRQ